MFIEFYKYQGTGNDFIIIDDREVVFDIEDHALIASLCERRMGIGADGLILLRSHTDLDFEMIYFNSDGFKSTMCGNGGRCIVAFAQMLKIIDGKANFMAIDGEHKAEITKDTVCLLMQNVSDIEVVDDALVIDTGSPHYIKMVDDLHSLDVDKEGRKIRSSILFREEGVNVNFVLDDSEFELRTYERGVEAETLSCGTGVVATAIAMYYTNYTKEDVVSVRTKGRVLTVDFEEFNGSYRNIWLTGEVGMVYAGEFEC